MADPIRQLIGEELRGLRKESGVPVKRAIRAIRRSRASLDRIENGLAPLKPDTIRTLGQLYRADADTIDHLVALAATTDTLRSGWWDTLGGPPSASFGAYLSAEQRATQIDMWAPLMVPGLLQTEEYALRVTPGRDDEEIRRRVAIRLRRQTNLLGRDIPVRIRVVLGEAAVRQVIGGAEIMRDQMAHLLHMSRRPNVQVRILPFTAGSHPGLDGGPIVVLRGHSTGIVYLETHSTAAYLVDPKGVERHLGLLDELSNRSFSVIRSRAQIAAVAWPAHDLRGSANGASVN